MTITIPSPISAPRMASGIEGVYVRGTVYHDRLDDMHTLAIEAIQDTELALIYMDMRELSDTDDVRDSHLTDWALDRALNAGIKRARIAYGDVAADRMARACRSVA